MENKFQNRVGEKHKNNQGLIAEIIEYFNATNCTIKFHDGTIYKNVRYGNITRGKFKNDNQYQIRIGEKHKNNQGLIAEIIEYFSATNCTIKFHDGIILKNQQYNNIINGNIKNINFPEIMGLGFIGLGKYNSINNEKIYKTWHQIFIRCYNKKYQLKYPSYVGCSVDERWHNFQVFAEWYEQNYIEGFHLDKDILVKGNKIYGPETCCFVPQEINNLFTKSEKTRGITPIGVSKINDKYVSQLRNTYLGTFNTIDEAFNKYKIAKELLIRNIANIWKNKIPNITYQAMYKYTVEITD